MRIPRDEASQSKRFYHLVTYRVFLFVFPVIFSTKSGTEIQEIKFYIHTNQCASYSLAVLQVCRAKKKKVRLF